MLDVDDGVDFDIDDAIDIDGDGCACECGYRGGHGC